MQQHVDPKSLKVEHPATVAAESVAMAGLTIGLCTLGGLLAARIMLGEMSRAQQRRRARRLRGIARRLNGRAVSISEYPSPRRSWP